MKKQVIEGKNKRQQRLRATIFLFLMFSMAILMPNFVSAWELNPFADVISDVNIKASVTSDYLKTDFNEKYGVIQISNTFFWIETDAIVEYSLIDNTEQCWENCEARGKATMYKDGKLFDGKTFIGVEKLSKSQYWIKVNKLVDVQVPDKVVQVCDNIADKKNPIYCQNETLTWKIEQQYQDVWEEYNYQELKAGNYEWKLTGTKEGSANVDFQLISNEKTLTKWAWWNGTGGTMTTDGLYTVVTFTTNGTFVWEGDNSNVSVLVVAGGGAGGGAGATNAGGGGGAGGYLVNTTYFVSAQNYTVIVGEGGMHGTQTLGANGANSSFGTLNAGGGGRGGALAPNNHGVVGGSGGGGSADGGLKGAGIVGQGNDGSNATSTLGGCGGGASTSCAYGNSVGGNGTANSINGTNMYYAGGGGGDNYNGATIYIGGLGGGGRGGASDNKNGVDGVNGTGGGGGGGGNGGDGGAGGSGIVIIRYLTSGSADATPIVTLTSPTAFYNSTSQDITFDCKASDDALLQNITLYLNNSINGTNTSVYNNTATTFSRSLADGYYSWNCGACDNASQCANGTAQYFWINTIPTIYVVSPPANNSNYTTQTIFINATNSLAIDDWKLNYNGTNYTITINSTFAFAEGTHRLLLYGRNAVSGNYGLNNTYYVSVDSVFPTITLLSGNTTENFGNTSVNHTVNYTITDSNIDDCWIAYKTTNTTINCTSGATNTTNFAFSYGVYNATLWANDTFGQTTHSSFNWSYRLFLVSETHNASVLEGSTQQFSTVLVTNGTDITIGNLSYNSTGYLGSISQSGNNFTITKTLATPTVTTNTNMPFFWKITQADGFVYNYTSKNQTLNNIGMDNCSINGNVLYNFTLKNERLQTAMPVGVDDDTTSQVNLQLYSYGTTNLIQSLNLNQVDMNSFSVCFNNTFADEKYNLDAQIKYSSNNYETEYYHIQNSTINNASFTTNITLYDLNSTESQAFKLIYKDSSFLPVYDALIVVGRKYIDEGVFKNVEIPKTDVQGETVAHLTLNTVIYNFTIIKNGVILGTFDNMFAVCQNPLVSECVIEFNSFAGAVGVPNFDMEGDFEYDLGYISATRTVQSNFTLPSGNPATILLRVEKSDALGTDICTDTLTSASGTLSCVLPASIGNSTIIATLYKNGYYKSWGSLGVNQTPTDIYGTSIMVFLSIIILITLGGIALSGNPIITVVLLMVGVILMFALNLVANNGFIGATATILFFVIACILLLIKGVKR